MLENANNAGNALAANQTQCFVANIIDGFRLLERVLLDAGHIRLFAGHGDQNNIGNFGHIKYWVRIISIHVQKNKSLLSAAHVRWASWIGTQIRFKLWSESFFFLHDFISVSLVLGRLQLFLVNQTMLDQMGSDLFRITGRAEIEKSYNLGSNVIKLVFASLDGLLVEKLFVVLCHEVKTSSLHDHLFTLGLALLI